MSFYISTSLLLYFSTSTNLQYRYKMFAAKILTKRLLDRKKAVMAIFYGLAREDPYTGETFLRLGEWKKICAEIKDRRYELTEESAEHIFGMEDHLRQGRVRKYLHVDNTHRTHTIRLNSYTYAHTNTHTFTPIHLHAG